MLKFRTFFCKNFFAKHFTFFTLCGILILPQKSYAILIFVRPLLSPTRVGVNSTEGISSALDGDLVHIMERIVINGGAKLYGDVYMLLSIFEETGGGGVVPAAFGIEPDYAMVIDVDLAAVPDAKTPTSIEMSKGPSITYTTATDRNLTKMLHNAAKEAEIPTQKFVSAASTGTNSVRLHLTGNGVPVVDVGLPLAFMHSATEIIDIVDCESLTSLVKLFVTNESIGKEYTDNE